MSPSNPPDAGELYDRIGTDYTSRRKADPRIRAQIEAALADCSSVVNVGAGAGSYEPATCTLAVEPSRLMIAQRPPEAAKCVQAVAEKLPLMDRSFDGALACLTIHHWSDVTAGLAEMRRVTRKRIVIFTWDPDFDADFWLPRDYLPAILQLDQPRFPTMQQLAVALPGMEIRNVPIPADCRDGFLGAYWKRPEAFLDPVVRQTNSVMAQLDPSIVHEGIERLRSDLRTGVWRTRNRDLENLESRDLGYRLVVSQSPGGL